MLPNLVALGRTILELAARSPKVRGRWGTGPLGMGVEMTPEKQHVSPHLSYRVISLILRESVGRIVDRLRPVRAPGL